MAVKRELYADDEGAKQVGTLLTMKDMQILKWQRMTYILSGIVLVCIGSVVYIGTKATYIPYVINVDEKTGYATSVGALDQKTVHVTDASINYFLSRFVEGMRTIPADQNLLTQNVNRSVRFLTPDAAKKYKELYMKDFTARIGHVLSKVTVLSVQPMAGQKNTYTVRWKETDSSGSGIVDHYFTGNFAVKQETLTKKEDLIYNPLGIFITDFSVSEEGGIK